MEVLGRTVWAPPDSPSEQEPNLWPHGPKESGGGKFGRPRARLALRSGDDEVLGDDDHFIIPRRLSSPAGDDRGMMIHFCVILYHPPVSSPRVR